MFTNNDTASPHTSWGLTDTPKFKVSLITLIVLMRWEQGNREVTDNKDGEWRHLCYTGSYTDGIMYGQKQRVKMCRKKQMLLVDWCVLLFTARDEWKNCWYGKREKRMKQNALDGSEDIMDGLVVQVSASVSHRCKKSQTNDTLCKSKFVFVSPVGRRDFSTFTGRWMEMCMKRVQHMHKMGVYTMAGVTHPFFQTCTHKHTHW